MKRLSTVAFVLTMAMYILAAQSTVGERAARLEERGQFTEAASLLRNALAMPGSDSAERTMLAFELDRLDRIRLDYALTREKLLVQVKRSVKDVTTEELERWIAEGKFDRRIIDGEERFLGVSRSNLFWRYPEIVARRINPPDERPFEQLVWETCSAISKEAERTGTARVLPKRFHTVMRLTVDPHTVAPGSIIRGWMPIPRLFPHQHDFRMAASSSPVKELASDLAPVRSAYLEQPADSVGGAVLRIEYDYTAEGVRFSLDPARVRPYDRNDADVKSFTAEGPHIVFTGKMKALSQEIAGNETNPLLKAKRFYEWIAEHIQYSYALEYSTIRNIGEYCLTKRYGDCGQEAFLFMTLCRLNGIPARWQSGWFTMPGGKTIHDWSEIYIPPYGWIPVDPYMGIFAMQYLKSLNREQRLEVRDFYFGGLDQYRMAANGDHCQTLTPVKHTFRSDVVDFQRGELESGEKNLYFNTWSYDLEVREIAP